jgi:tetratricopeptide (TPR) repeat protein
MKLNRSTPNQDAQVQHAIFLHQSGRLDEALDEIRRLSKALPQNALLLTHYGTIELQKGNVEKGVRVLQQALRADPDQRMALANCASGLGLLGRLEEALSYYGRAAVLSPTDPELFYNQGVALEGLERLGEALASYDRAIDLNGNYAEAHNNRGLVLKKLGRLAEALESCDRAVALKKDYAKAYNNRGAVLQELNRMEEAIESYDRAITLKPDYAVAYNNRGTVFQETRRFEEAEENYNRAIAIQPDYAEAHLNQSLLKLLMGDYLAGWPLHEWRWKTTVKKTTHLFKQRPWLGEEFLKGKTILIYPEQGIGDFIQFCRYIPLLEKEGAKIILVVPRPLVRLFSGPWKRFAIVEDGQSFPAFDIHCPLMSLPMIFKTTLETIPAEIPYLFPDLDLMAVWRQRLGVKGKKRIGLVWSGNPNHKNDLKRSVPLGCLSPLWSLPFEFHSLQKEYRGNDRLFMEESGIRDHQGELNDFSDTAALISEMDLVLSVDTSVAHLAGAMGKPVWVLLPFMPDFRWLLDRSDSPWYPTATLFRQATLGDWGTVLSEVAVKMKKDFT